MASSLDDRDEDEELYDSPKKKQKRGTPDVPYYLRNFNIVLNHTLTNAHNQSLFPAEELQQLYYFQELSELSQQLYVRLFLRQRKWMPKNKISYPKIAFDLSPVLNNLVENCLLLDAHALNDLPFLLELLQLPELRQLCRDLKITTAGRTVATKPALVDAVLKHARQYKPLFGKAPSSEVAVLKRVKSLVGPCYKLSPEPDRVFRKCMFLFSLESSLVDEDDDSQEAQQIIYRLFEVDIGKIHFPDYSIIVTQPLFPSMDEFDRYCKAHERKVEAQKAADSGDLMQVMDIASSCLTALLSNTSSCMDKQGDTTLRLQNVDQIESLFAQIVQEEEVLSAGEGAVGRPKRTVSAPVRYQPATAVAKSPHTSTRPSHEVECTTPSKNTSSSQPLPSPSRKEKQATTTVAILSQIPSTSNRTNNSATTTPKARFSAPCTASTSGEEQGNSPCSSNVIVLSDSEEDSTLDVMERKTASASKGPTLTIKDLSGHHGSQQNGSFEKRKVSHKIVKRGKLPKRSKSTQSKIMFKQSQLVIKRPETRGEIPQSDIGSQQSSQESVQSIGEHSDSQDSFTEAMELATDVSAYPGSSSKRPTSTRSDSSPLERGSKRLRLSLRPRTVDSKPCASPVSGATVLTYQPEVLGSKQVPSNKRPQVPSSGYTQTFPSSSAEKKSPAFEGEIAFQDEDSGSNTTPTSKKPLVLAASKDGHILPSISVVSRSPTCVGEDMDIVSGRDTPSQSVVEIPGRSMSLPSGARNMVDMEDSNPLLSCSGEGRKLRSATRREKGESSIRAKSKPLSSLSALSSTPKMSSSPPRGKQKKKATSLELRVEAKKTLRSHQVPNKEIETNKMTSHNPKTKISPSPSKVKSSPSVSHLAADENIVVLTISSGSSTECSDSDFEYVPSPKDRKWSSKNRKQDTENRKWDTENRKPGNRKLDSGNRKVDAGDRKWSTENRKKEDISPRRRATKRLTFEEKFVTSKDVTIKEESTVKEVSFKKTGELGLASSTETTSHEGCLMTSLQGKSPLLVSSPVSNIGSLVTGECHVTDEVKMEAGSPPQPHNTAHMVNKQSRPSPAHTSQQTVSKCEMHSSGYPSASLVEACTSQQQQSSSCLLQPLSPSRQPSSPPHKLSSSPPQQPAFLPQQPSSPLQQPSSPLLQPSSCPQQPSSPLQQPSTPLLQPSSSLQQPSSPPQRPLLITSTSVAVPSDPVVETSVAPEEIVLSKNPSIPGTCSQPATETAQAISINTSSVAAAVAFDQAVTSSKTSEEMVPSVVPSVPSTHSQPTGDNPDATPMKQMTSKYPNVAVLNIVVEVLEKKRRYKEACSLLFFLVGSEGLGFSKRGHWYERLALNLDFHLKRYEESLDVIQEGIADTSVHPARKYSLLQRALKICKSQKTPARIKRLPEISVHPYSEKTIYARTHPRKNQASYALFMKPTSSPSGNSQDFELVSVEEFSLVHYKENEGWTRGVHCEGSAFSTLFALLFWDVIFFYDVPNVFRSRYQHLPMDFNTPGFYVNRKTAIDERLEWIKSATKEAIGCKVEQAWREYNEERCGLLSWNLVNSAEDIKTLSMCLGPDLLWRVCTLYATLTYSHYRSGLPDLLLWRPETLQCKFVEVKGPNDRLSAKQILWLGRLSEWNCEAQVCWVKVK